jgi:hypothetical protein
MDDVMRTLPGTRQREEWRLKKIEQLMESDTAPDTDEGRLLNALVDEQMEAEKHIVIAPQSHLRGAES